jgi:predicted porin
VRGVRARVTGSFARNVPQRSVRAGSPRAVRRLGAGVLLGAVLAASTVPPLARAQGGTGVVAVAKAPSADSRAAAPRLSAPGPSFPTTADKPGLLYGRVDANLTRRSGQPWTVSQASTSRVGLQGREPVGGGLVVSFEIETSFDPGSGEGPETFGDRERWVGVEGRLGRLRAGLSLTPSQRLASKQDPHGTDGLGSFGATGLLLGLDGAARFDRALHYESPRWRGTDLSLAATPDLASRSALLRQGIGATRLSLGHVHVRDRGHVTSIGLHRKLGQRSGKGAEHVAKEGAWTDVAVMAQAHVGRVDGERRHGGLIGLTATRGGLAWRASVSAVEAPGRDNDRRLVALGADHALGKSALVYATLVHEREGTQVSGLGIEAGVRIDF